MKTMLLVAASAAVLGGCAATSGPTTAWGKEGVSMLDYQAEGAACAVIAAKTDP